MNLQYPLLTNSNYLAWALKMNVYMKAQGVWDAVETEEDVDLRKDQMVLAAIYQGISEESLLSEKETTKEAWSALKIMHMGAERVMEDKVKTLKSEFECLRMKQGEAINAFAVRLTILVSKMRTLGEKMEITVVKILHAVTAKYLPITSTLEQFGDLKKMIAEEVFGGLKAHE